MNLSSRKFLCALAAFALLSSVARVQDVKEPDKEKKKKRRKKNAKSRPLKSRPRETQTKGREKIRVLERSTRNILRAGCYFGACFTQASVLCAALFAEH